MAENSIHYYCEVMSGFEYAATMVQYGMTREGMEMVREISKRYDGRHRGKGQVTMASTSSSAPSSVVSSTSTVTPTTPVTSRT